jgi:tetratricopeptide (TPR) repeat protein
MKKGKTLLFITIIIGIVFLFNVSCTKLSYSTLNGNFHFKKANAKYLEEDYQSAAKEYENTIKANPDFIAAYYYLGSCYQQLFKPALPVNKKMVEELGNKLDKITDMNELKDVVYQINLINDYEKLIDYIKNLKVEEVNETKEEEKNESAENPEKEVKEQAELKTQEKDVKTGENKVKNDEKQIVEKKELTKDEKVAQIIKKWEEEKKAEEARKKAEAEAKKKAQQALIVTEQPTQTTGNNNPEETKPPELTPQQKKMMTKNTVRAIKALANAILVKTFNTASMDSAIALAELYDNLGIFEKAEKYYNDLLKKYNTNKAYYVISEFYSKYGKDKKAEEYLNKAISLNPNDPTGYLYLERFYIQKLKYDDAIKALEKNIELIEKEPNVSAHDKAVAYFRLGVDCWVKSYKKKYLPKEERIKVLDKGFAAIEKAMELDKNYPEPYAYYNLLLRQKPIVDPKNRNKYIAEAKKYAAKFNQLYKKLQARKKLAKELEKQK